MTHHFNKYMLFAGWEVGPQAAFSRPQSQFFTIRTDPKPVNNFFFFPSCETKKTHGKNSRKRYCDRGQR